MLRRFCHQVPHLSELGVIAATGPAKVAALIEIVRDETDARLPKAARFALTEIAHQIETLGQRIDKLECDIVAEAKRDEDMRRLTTIPGVGAITAASMKALVPDPDGFKSGRSLPPLEWGLDCKPPVSAAGATDPAGPFAQGTRALR